MMEWDPGDYSVNSAAQFASARELINWLNLKGAESILDIGCGDGKITAQIANLVPAGTVTGIDASRPMIEFALAKFPEASHPNLHFAVMGAQEITFENQFDIVFSNAALHWVPDHGPVLSGIRRCLKPGGKMNVQMAGKGTLAQLIKAFVAVLSDPHWRGNFGGFKAPHGFYEPEPYRQWVKDAGLKEIRIELVPRTMTQKGREGLIGFLRTTWLSIIDRIPPNEREEFINRIADEYLKENPMDASGNVKVETMRLEVEAVKP